MNIETFRVRFAAIRQEVSKVVIGQDPLIEQVLVAALVKGHVLIEGVPGLGKTLLVRTLGHVLGCSFKRIQFTPDLMPSDVTGGNVFNQKEDRFVFMPGPVFTEVLLADEINRAPAKTQSSLLEAMQERSVTTDGVTRPLPSPFLVIATQNPVENQGTYPLPEAQLDRFLLKLNVNHPSIEAEQQVLQQYLHGFDPAALDRTGISVLTNAEELLMMQNVINTVRVSAELLAYITDIVARTRNHSAVYLGASPRASIALLVCAQASAAAQGRDFVIPDDIKRFAPSVIRHRLVLHADAELEGVGADECIASILREAPVPRAVA